VGQRYLLDTNTVIDFMGNKLQAHAKASLSNIIDTEINLSIINKIELLSFSIQDPKLVDFINNANIYPLDDKIVDITIEIRRKSKIKLPDAVIAATALVYDLTLISRNIEDFKNIPNLKLINSHKL